MAPKAVPQHIDQNIKTVTQLRRGIERKRSRHQRAVDAATLGIGRPATLYFLVLVVLLWTIFNGLAPRNGMVQVDPPPFLWLQGASSLYAAFVTTIVLTTQNRQNREAERRAMLELQINLLSEQKTTKIIALLEELRRDLPNVSDREDPIAEALQVEVDPHAVISVLEEASQTFAIDTVLDQESDGKSRGPPRHP